MADPMIELSTLIERPVIEIDGETHELTAPDELTIMQSARIAALGRKLDVLMKTENPQPQDQKALEKVLEELTGLIMAPVPHEVRSRLAEAHQLAVIEVFTTLLLARKTKLAGATMFREVVGGALDAATKAAAKEAAAKKVADGQPSQPGASGSTAATPGAG